MKNKLTYEELEQRVAELEQQVERFRSEAMTYQTLFNSFPHGITVSDAEGKILQTNVVAEKLLGLSKEEHEKRSIDGPQWRILRPDGSDMPPHEWASVIALKEKRLVSDCELGIVKSGDDITWITATAAPLPVEGHGVVVTYSDITKRKQIEKELRENENRFRQFFDNAGFYGYIVSPEGIILEVNNTALETLGYSADELIGRPLFDLYADESIDEAKKVFHQWKATGHVNSAELIIKSKNGDRRWILLNVDSVRDASGCIVHSTSIQVDITERKKAEEKLRLYEIIVSATSEPMAVIDGNYTFLQMNAAYENFWGLHKNEILGKRVPEIIGEDKFRETVKANVDRCFAGRKISYSAWFESPVFGLRYMNLNYHPFSASNGQITALINISYDLTEQKKTEDALRESEEKFRALVESAPVSIMLLRNGKYIYGNPASVELLGFQSPLEIEGLDALKPIAPESRDLVLAHMQNIEKGTDNAPIEVRIVKPDGTFSWSLSTSVSVRIDEKPTAIIVGQDITDKKNTEEALYKKAERYQKLVNTSPYGIQLTDLEGRIIFSNPAHHRIQGYAEGELIGKYIWDLMADSTHKEQTKLYYRKIVKEHSLPKIYFSRDRTQDGRDIDVQINWDYIYGQNGEIEGIISIISDITAQRKLETQLRQAQKMEAIGSLAGGIAHDLNNILFPISGLSEMLLDEMPPDDPAYENIEQILNSAKRGSDLVKQILAFSRQSNPQKLPVRLQPILKEVLKLSRATIPMNIEITSIIDANCSMVSADPTQMHQVAMNLITNAFHAVEDNGGTIHVGLKEKEFSKDDYQDHYMQAGRYACITVSDTGNGIDQILVDKIFEPYFTTKELGKGTGLGLSVVHGIVKEHGGDIRVYSEVDKGTTFHVFLPLLEDAIEKNAKISRKYPTGTERILLVDDEEPIARMMQTMLERLGYQVTTRTSSLDALDTFRVSPSRFDMVISDRGMPNMTGEQLAGELLLIKPDIPIIICTGFSDENAEQHARSIGVKGFLKKPVSTGDLAEMVRKLIDEATGHD
jgi:PAS domain S-box-containing protein